MHIVVLGNGENPAVRVRGEDLAYIFLDGCENCGIAETRLCGLIAIFGQSRQRVDKADPLVVAIIDVVRTHPFGILRTDPVELSIFKRRDKVIGESFRQIHVALLQDRSIYMQIPPTHPFCEKLVQHVCELPVAPEVEIAVPYRDGETALRHIGGRREYNQSLRSFCLDTYGQCGTDGLSEFLLEEQFEDKKKSEIIDDLDELAEGILDNLEDEYGDDIKISVKYKDKNKIDKDDLEDLEEMYEDNYDSKVKISKGYEVEIKATIKGDDEKETDTTTLSVYKINGDWCIMSFEEF